MIMLPAIKKISHLVDAFSWEDNNVPCSCSRISCIFLLFLTVKTQEKEMNHIWTSTKCTCRLAMAWYRAVFERPSFSYLLSWWEQGAGLQLQLGSLHSIKLFFFVIGCQKTQKFRFYHLLLFIPLICIQNKIWEANATPRIQASFNAYNNQSTLIQEIRIFFYNNV